MVLFTKHHLTFMSSETISENKLTSIASLKASTDVDLVRSYLRDIGRVPLLSHEQEITLGRQVQEYMEVDKFNFVDNSSILGLSPVNSLISNPALSTSMYS